MAKEEITCLAVRDDVLEWTTFRRIKERLEATGSGRLELRQDENAAKRANGTPEERGSREEAGGETVAQRIKAELGVLRGDVTAGISSEQVLLRVVDLPAASEAELSSMVELQADKFSPFPVESMVVSHEVLEGPSTEPVAGKNDTRAVLIAAVREDVLASLGELLGPAEIFPARVDAVVLGWWQLLKSAGEISAKGRQVVLLMDGAAPEIIVSQDGVPVVFRVLGKCGDLTEEEFAGQIAREVGYTLMSLELERGDGGTCSISVRHRAAAPAALVENLRNECSCEVTVKTLDSLPPLLEGLAGRTAERDGTRVNLIPATWRAARQTRLFKKRLLMAGGALLAVWASGAGIFLGGFHYQGRKLAFWREEQEKWRKPAMEVQEMRSRVSMIGRYTDRTRSALECLREITVLQPKGVILTSFIYKKAKEVNIMGEADTAGLVLTFNDRLNASKLFSKVIPGERSITRRRKHRFKFDLKLQGGDR